MIRPAFALMMRAIDAVDMKLVGITLKRGAESGVASRSRSAPREFGDECNLTM
jgi:hypothetical protein